MMTVRIYKHRYNIEEDYFLRMASERLWAVSAGEALYFIYDGKGQALGVYDPRNGQFATDLAPTKPDPRVVPCCD